MAIMDEIIMLLFWTAILSAILIVAGLIADNLQPDHERELADAIERTRK